MNLYMWNKICGIIYIEKVNFTVLIKKIKLEHTHTHTEVKRLSNTEVLLRYSVH